MTDEPEPGGDALAGRWLDGTESPRDLAGLDDVAGRDRRRAADLLLTDALLTRILSPDEGAGERRVQLVLAGLKAEDEPPAEPRPQRVRPGARGRRLVSAAASLAALVLVSVLAWRSAALNTAYAVVAEAAEAAGQDQDRTYRVTDDPGWTRRKPRESTLSVRGNRFLFRPGRPVFPGLVLGSNGRESWAVSTAGPTLVCDDPRAYFRVLLWGIFPPRPAGPTDPKTADGDNPLYLHFPTMLRRCLLSYTLEMLSPEAPPGSDVVCRAVLARRSPDADGPATIQLWVRPAAGVIQRLQLRLQYPVRTRVITLDLVSQEPLASRSYEHSAYDRAAAEVRTWCPGRGLTDPPIPWLRDLPPAEPVPDE